MTEMDRERKTTSYFTCLMKEKKQQQQHAFDCANRVSSRSVVMHPTKVRINWFLADKTRWRRSSLPLGIASFQLACFLHLLYVFA